MNSDRLRDALPFLRPRIEEPSGIVLLFFGLICTALIALIAHHILRWHQERRRLYKRLCERGSERGLSPEELAFLVPLAKRAKLANPSQLINTPYAFDRTIGPIVNELIAEDWHHEDIAQIERIRAQLGFDYMASDQPLRTTRQLAEGLTLMVWCDSEELEAFYPWIIVHRDERALTVAPLLKEDFARYANLDTRSSLAVRFWRSTDTEYRFVSMVLSTDSSQRTVTLQHGDDLERLEQRDFYRINVYFDIHFWLLEDADETASTTAETPTEPMRISATVLDLSAGGLEIETSAPIFPQGVILQVVPDFEGPFPLAELRCQIVQQKQVGENNRLQLRFDSVPAAREAELVRSVYEQQLRKANAQDALPET